MDKFENICFRALLLFSAFLMISGASLYVLVWFDTLPLCSLMVVILASYGIHLIYKNVFWLWADEYGLEPLNNVITGVAPTWYVRRSKLRVIDGGRSLTPGKGD